MSQDVQQGQQQDLNKRREHPIEIRVAVVTLRFFYQESYTLIGKRLNIHRRTVQGIYERAVARCHDPTDFKELVACVGDAERSGRPVFIVEGTPVSQQLRALFAEHYEINFESVTILLTGLKVARSTLERIAYDHRDSVHDHALVRRVQYLKPTLSLDHQDLRSEFCKWALRELARGAIFIFTDECYVEFGAPHRRKAKITRPKGHPDPFEFAGFIGPPQFKLMLWSAIGPLPHFPMWIWKPESEE